MSNDNTALKRPISDAINLHSFMLIETAICKY